MESRSSLRFTFIRLIASKRTERVHRGRQMPLPGSVFAAPPGMHGLMSIRCLIAALARLRKQGDLHFVFDTYPARTCSRRKTCPRQRPYHPRCRAGLDACSARCPRELVTVASAGDQNGKNAAKHAQQIGFPEGVNVWLDLEGAKASTLHETMIAYCNAWFAEIEEAGFVSGVYVGARAF